jgi:hypothetical protein
MKPFLLCVVFLLAAWGLRAASVQIVLPENASTRVRFGAGRIQTALREAGLDVTERAADGATRIVLGSPADAEIRRILATAPTLAGKKPGPEGFLLARDGAIAVAGGDDSGILYGCLELAERIRAGHGLPAKLAVADQPVFTLRGPCIGMQKPYILPGRHVYEYPYTRDLFPFFYDKSFWIGYLDTLADQRMNTLYLWAGHPFGSLVRLKDYPEALEVSEDQFAQNADMFRFIAEECDRRGIWLVQMFYNIILPKPFAEKHGIPTQLSKPTPLASDYTRKAIAEFVARYPHVGLMPCLGEALQGTPNQIEWATKVIIPGVRDGMKMAGLTEEPPIVFRTHAMNPGAIMPRAFEDYSNLFTVTKYNGESLTTWQPRGKNQATHLAMAKLGPHLVNIHILSNLEPFRYGATEFIRKSMLASRDRLGASGLHLYPLSYWNWPDSPDVAPLPLKQWERDWIWFESWARYAWNPDRDVAGERAYWSARIGDHYGVPHEAAEKIFDAYNATGEVAPRLIRRFGITEGNRQTLSLGMLLDELVRPEKYGVISDLWLSQSPPGERLQDYVAKELAHQPHTGETPPQIVREVDDFSRQAVDALAAAASQVTKNRDEFERLANDAACIRAMALNYGAKAEAARHVLTYQKTHDVHEMELADAALARSLGHFRRLEQLTRDTYHFANSMQTSQRRIPVVGGDLENRPANYHWSQLLPVYEKELADFSAQVAALKSGGPAAFKAQLLATMEGAPFTLHGSQAEVYTVKAGNAVFTDDQTPIQTTATELEGLKGIRFPRAAAAQGSLGPIEFSSDVPVRVLIGYAREESPEWRPAPRSEFDAAAAARGGTEPLLVDAVKIPGMPTIDVYELSFEAGRHKIEPSGSGAFLILGVVRGK